MSFEMALPQTGRVKAFEPSGVEICGDDQEVWELFKLAQQEFDLREAQAAAPGANGIGGGRTTSPDGSGTPPPEDVLAAPPPRRPLDPARALEALSAARGEADVIIDLVTALESAQFARAEHVPRRTRVPELVRDRRLRLAAKAAGGERCAAQLREAATALRSRGAAEATSVAQLSRLRARWLLELRDASGQLCVDLWPPLTLGGRWAGAGGGDGVGDRGEGGTSEAGEEGAGNRGGEGEGADDGGEVDREGGEGAYLLDDHLTDAPRTEAPARAQRLSHHPRRVDVHFDAAGRVAVVRWRRDRGAEDPAGPWRGPSPEPGDESGGESDGGDGGRRPRSPARVAIGFESVDAELAARQLTLAWVVLARALRAGAAAELDGSDGGNGSGADLDEGRSAWLALGPRAAEAEAAIAEEALAGGRPPPVGERPAGDPPITLPGGATPGLAAAAASPAFRAAWRARALRCSASLLAPRAGPGATTSALAAARSAACEMAAWSQHEAARLAAELALREARGLRAHVLERGPEGPVAWAIERAEDAAPPAQPAALVRVGVLGRLRIEDDGGVLPLALVAVLRGERRR